MTPMQLLRSSLVDLVVGVLFINRLVLSPCRDRNNGAGQGFRLSYGYLQSDFFIDGLRCGFQPVYKKDRLKLAGPLQTAPQLSVVFQVDHAANAPNEDLNPTRLVVFADRVLRWYSSYASQTLRWH